MNKIPPTARRLRPALALFLACGFFAWALQYTMEQRHQVRKLTRQVDRMQIATRALKDERRSLALEYLTFTDYEKLRAAAADLGMREPDTGDGSLVFIAERGGERS
ncbi:MAG: cell division protein FtsL [Gammaproteobacteria bacterium]